MKTWLILDVCYLAHRAFHTTGGLNNGDVDTGTLFGVLRDVLSLQEEHATRDVVFAFDYGIGKRQALFPGYKASRRNKVLDPGETALRESFYRQVDLLREKYLPKLGYSNVLYADGYEADDVIASVVTHSVDDGDTSIIVTSDKDLFQLLSPFVMVWNPTKKKMTTRSSFFAEWGIPPHKWPIAKALAGCSTDDVPGIQGVGEFTACKYIQNKIKPGGIIEKRLNEQAEAFVKQNLPLVKLPLDGCPKWDLKPDEITSGKWRRLLEHLQFNTLIPEIPILAEQI